MHFDHQMTIALTKRACSYIACALLVAAGNAPSAAATSASPPIPALPIAPQARPIIQITTRHGETVTFRLSAAGSVSADGTFPASAAAYSTQAGHQKYATPLALFHAVAPNLQPPLILVEANARYISQQLSAFKPAPIRAAQAPRVPRMLAPMDATDDWFVSTFCQGSPNICDTQGYSWAYLFDQSVFGGYAVALAKTQVLKFSVYGVGSWAVPQGYYRWAQKWVSGLNFDFGTGDFTWDASVANAQFFDFESEVWPG